MSISITSNNNILGNYNSSALNKIQINTHSNEENKTASPKEMGILNQGKHLTKQSLEVTFQSTSCSKLQEYLDRKVTTLNQQKDMIEKKYKKDDETKSSMEEDINTKEEIEFSEEDKLTIKDIDKQLRETNFSIEENIKLSNEITTQSKIVNDKIDMYKKWHGNDMFARAQKEAILEQTYNLSNNPLVQELKSTINEISKLETQINDSLNENQSKDNEETKA